MTRLLLGLLIFLLPASARAQQWVALPGESYIAYWDRFGSLFQYRLLMYENSSQLNVLVLSCLRDGQLVVLDREKRVDRDWESIAVGDGRMWRLQEIACSAKAKSPGDGAWVETSGGLEMWSKYSALGQYRLMLIREADRDAKLFLLDCQAWASKQLVAGEVLAGLGGTPLNQEWRHEVLAGRAGSNAFFLPCAK